MKKIVALILAAQFALLAPYSYSQSAIHSGSVMPMAPHLNLGLSQSLMPIFAPCLRGAL